MFKELADKKVLKVYDWECYNIYRPQDFFEHPSVSWDTVEKYYKLAYKRMIYTNPWFYLQTAYKGYPAETNCFTMPIIL